MSGGPGRTRRMRLLAVASLLVTFLAGGLAGAAVERARGGDEPAETHDRRPPGMGERRRGGPPIFEAGGPLDERLGLTPQQRDTIQRIVRRNREKADSLFREMRPRLRARYDSTQDAIEAVLTPEQREEFRRMREERRGRGRGRPGPGGRGPV